MVTQEVRYCTTSDGVRIAYCVEGEGPPLLMCTNFIESFSVAHYFPQLEAFWRKIAEHHQLIRFDVRGTGLSQRNLERYSLAGICLDMEAVVAAARLKKLSIWASGAGGVYAIRYAASHNRSVDRLVIYGSYLRVTDGFSADAMRAYATLWRANPEVAAQTMADYGTRHRHSEAFAQVTRTFRESVHGEDAARILEDSLDPSWNAEDSLSLVSARTLVMHRRDDATFPFAAGQAIAAGIKNARFLPLQGDIHDYALEDSAAVLDATLAFLAEGARKPRPARPIEPPPGALAHVGGRGVREPRGAGDKERGGAGAGVSGEEVVMGADEPGSVELAIRYATTADGVSIAWGEAGDGPALLHFQAPPFSHVQEVFANGLPGCRGLARSFRLIMFDARGTGLSERDVVDVSASTLVADAEAVIEAAKLDRFVVVTDTGLLSLSTALRLALALPERITHLVFTDPVQSVRDLENSPYGRIGLGLAEADWDMYVQTVFRVLAGFDQGESSWVDPYAKGAAKWVDPDVGLRYMRLQQATDVGELLADITQPTLVLLRSEQTIVPARASQRVAAAIPGGQFRQYSDPNFVRWPELIRDFVGQAAPRPKPAAATASGTAVILFTDIAESTALTERMGDAAFRELSRALDAGLRGAIREAGGEAIEGKLLGDGVLATFPSAAQAIEGARRCLALSAASELGLHIGLHAGDVIREEGNVFGGAVNIASRICGLSAAGEILASDVVRGMARSSAAVMFEDRGEREMKGVGEPVRVYAVRAPATAPETAGLNTLVLDTSPRASFANGRYTVQRILGEGGQKLVFLVHDASLDRDCALALLKTELAEPDDLARMWREAQAMAQLKAHTNIVTVYDLGEEDGRPYIVCEYVPQGDLQSELRRAGGPLALRRALSIAVDVCRALAVAHGRGIVHRDVKPANIWLSDDGSAKLGDFGIAATANATRLTMTGTIVGSATNMSPEQAQGERVDARSDLYAVGCLLYELVVGEPPFSGTNPLAIVSQHVHSQPPSPRSKNSHLPKELDALIVQLLKKDREERPISAEQVANDLGAILDRLPA